MRLDPTFMKYARLFESKRGKVSGKEFEALAKSVSEWITDSIAAGDLKEASQKCLAIAKAMKESQLRKLKAHKTYMENTAGFNE